MKNSLRLLLLTVVGTVGLAFAGPALASFAPYLTVEQTSYKVGAGTTVDFVIGSDPADDPIAKMQIFSPAGYSATLGHAPGTKLGTAFAVVKAGALGGALLPLSGDVVVGDPNNATLKAASLACTGVATPNQEIWVLDTSLQGQAVQVPAFVNQVGPYLIQQICLPAPANAVFQAQLIGADYNVKGVFTNASTKGGYQWDGVFTPYNGLAPNPAGTNEWRTYVGLPSTLTLRRVKSKPSVVSFAGAFSIAGLNSAGIRLDLYAGAKAQPAPNATLGGTGKRVVRTKRLKSNGKFTLTRPKVKKKTFFQMRFQNYGIAPPCDGPSPTGLPLPCGGTDLAPLTSAQIKVLPPPKKKKHK